MLSSILLILLGLVLLAGGGELLVRGAVSIAQHLGLSSLVTGVVIVGAATSMPEMAASLDAALAGSPGIAWGNIVGSNIANTLLILGIVALVAPFALTGAGKRDAVVGLIASVVIGIVAYRGMGAAWIGVVLLSALVIYVIWRVRHPRKAGAIAEVEDEIGEMPDRLWVAIAIFTVGVAMLVGGGRWLVEGAVDLARLANISEVAIGSTIVAIGTSLPELAASVAAALRGKPGLALGNVVGSNVFNLLLIGGVTMAVAPVAPSAELLDIEWPVLVGSGLMLVLLCAYANRMGRALGAIFLAAFALNSALVFVG